MNSDIDLEAQQVARAAPRAGAFFPVCRHRRSGNDSRDVGGAEIHEMDILGPSISRSGQDINETQSVISQVEGVTSIWPCCLTQ
jgi:hypothetical protein